VRRSKIKSLIIGKKNLKVLQIQEYVFSSKNFTYNYNSRACRLLSLHGGAHYCFVLFNKASSSRFQI
jgi:hypothetical protein